MVLDDIDRALVDALLEDGRASTQDLAAAVDVAPETVERRIEALEDAGVIEGYAASVDYDELGYDVTALVRLRVGESVAAVAETLATCAWARSVYEVTGEADFLLVGRFRDTDDMHENVAELLTEPAVRSVTVDVVLDAVRACEPLWIGDGVI
ncbi:transcriptional regulator, AsnC family [Halorhabdus utahensis DSM 12940]|uniref:Transcriptional regulator, AsnC family n=1 Tax=Halorhabdus utahensis (strain DSM 12940 / JCM 11049 / AX-2) TaxID=519442 RepID=C7NND4_HALUD|nr:Lrp/AsnC family transcriptional regulator [Halorhabdus utahensis]ACV11534.1 transcriptional regulator, AsnC family [Halorhabdus utahensis DSM 12940]